MEFNLNAISKYRSEIMGLSAIAILFCHAPARGVVMPSVLARLMELGGLGVDVFLILSGIGIWYSLEKLNFYKWGGGNSLVFKEVYAYIASVCNDCYAILFRTYDIV